MIKQAKCNKIMKNLIKITKILSKSLIKKKLIEHKINNELLTKSKISIINGLIVMTLKSNKKMKKFQD